MSDYSDLISQFGTGSDNNTNVAPNSAPSTPHDDLISEFGSGGVVIPGGGIGGSTKVIFSKKVGDVGYTVNPDDFKKPAYKGEDGKSTNPTIAGIQDAATAVPNYILNLPANTWQDIKTNFDNAGQLGTQAVQNIETGHPYKAVGDLGLGALSTLNAIPAAVINNTVTQPASNIFGPEVGGKIGDIANAVLPVAGPVAGVLSKVPYYPTAQKIAANLPRNRAFQALVDTIEPQNIPQALSDLRSNPRLSLMDVSPAAKQAVQQLFVTEGPKTVNYLSNVAQQRMRGAQSAVGNIFDTSMGGPVINAYNKIQQLKAAAADVGQNKIQPALNAAKPVNVSPVLDHIDNIVKLGVNSVISLESGLPHPEITKQLIGIKRLLTDGKEVRTDAKQLHVFQSALRNEADNLINSSDGASRRLGYAIYQVRNKLVSAIDQSAPGYKKALSSYADAKHIDEAFRSGYSEMLTNSKKLEDRPEFFKEWVDSLSPAEKEAFKEGARLGVDTKIRSVKASPDNAARAGTDIPLVDFNKEKLGYLFGKPEIEQMSKRLEDERKIALTNYDLIRGSQTAMRSAVNSKIALPEKTDFGKSSLPFVISEAANIAAGGFPGVGALTYEGAKLGAKGKDVIKTKLAMERNFQLAKMASASDGPLRDQLIQELSNIAAPRPKPSIVNRAYSTLSKVIAP